MILTVKPQKSIKGTIELPGSKSYSIRAFFVALCGGKSRVMSPSNCEDALVAMRVAKALGASIKKIKGGYSVTARNKPVKKKKLRVDVGESGTSLRFVLPLLSFYGHEALVKGKGTLVGRPNFHLCSTLRAAGMRIHGEDVKESVPIVYRGGELAPGRLTIDGSLSSQFVSALLIACPRLLEDTVIDISGKEMVSGDYIVMTRQILEKSGIKVTAAGERGFFVPGKQVFKGLSEFAVPSDYGLAAFFMAAGALVPSSLCLKGRLDDHYIQSDGAIFSLLTRMGVCLSKGSSCIEVKGPFDLHGGEFSLKSCPDLVPIMAVLAMFAKGETRLVDIRHARVKESDRISDLALELRKVGADVREKEDALVVRPKKSYKAGVLLDPHNDHRLAMAFSVLGLRAGVRVRDIECTAKSYPDFVKHLRAVTGQKPR